MFFRLMGMIFGALLVIAPLACGGAPKGGDMGQAPAELREVNELLRQAGSATNKAPAKISDLERFKDNFVLGHGALKAGKVVVFWGTPFAGEGDVGKNEAPLAYEKEVPTAGGYMLFSAGSIKKISPDEFKALKK